jgi:hypothetical protein
MNCLCANRSCGALDLSAGHKHEVLLVTTIRYQFFPTTSAPPAFVEEIISVFRKHESEVSTHSLPKGLTSDQFLAVVKDDLQNLKFQVETGKVRTSKIPRPVLFGENGSPKVTYDIDAYQPNWQAVLEVEAGRAWMGNAVYRDLVRTCVMVQAKYLVLAVPNTYKYKSGGRSVTSTDYDNIKDLLETLYLQTKFRLPFDTVLIGY